MSLGLQSTLRLLRAVDASRPLLCLVTILLSMAFTVLLYMHIPMFMKPENYRLREPQPMFVLPSMIILVHICAAVIGIGSYRCTVGAHTWYEVPCSAFFSVVAYGSVFFAPVVGWIVLKAADGPSMRDLLLEIPGVWWDGVCWEAREHIEEEHIEEEHTRSDIAGEEDRLDDYSVASGKTRDGHTDAEETIGSRDPVVDEDEEAEEEERSYREEHMDSGVFEETEESIHFEEVFEAPTEDDAHDIQHAVLHDDVVEDLWYRNGPAHLVLSSAWSRVAIAAAAMEASSLEPERLFTHHASTLGNGVIVLCTIALAAPDESTLLPAYARAVGVAAVVAAVLYQASVFVPGTFARPPMMVLLFLLCFTHDIATVVGALSCVGTCEGSGCVSLAGYGFAYDVSTTSLAVLCSIMLVVPLAAIACTVGCIGGILSSESEPVIKFLIGIMVALGMLYGGIVFLTFLAFFPAIALCVPCLSLVATMVLGLGPRDPAAAAGHTLLHVFCDKVNAAFMQAAALVEPGSAPESVSLPPLCESSVLCRGPRAAEIHVLRHHAAQHLDKLCFRVVEAQRAPEDDVNAYEESAVYSFTSEAPRPHTADIADDEPRREIVDEDLVQQFAVSMAEAAAVLTPHPTPAALPTNVLASPMAYLTEHLVAAEVAASAERRAPLAQFIAGAELGPPCAGDSAAPTIASAARSPADAANASSSYCHIDLATETFEHALEGGWAWLLHFAWRRRSFAPLPGHATPRVFVDMWRDSGTFARMKAFGAWATLAALLLSRPVLFFAPLLEPAFNTNVPTTAYVCIAVRVVCWVGLAAIAPALYRTVCRTAAFSAVHGPAVGTSEADGMYFAMNAAARCIAAAYTPHLPTVLRRAVPHHVVSHVVIGDAVAPFLRPKQLKRAPLV